MLYIHMSLLQVYMGIWTPHYIKQNNSYHSLMEITSYLAFLLVLPIILIGKITKPVCKGKA